MRRSTSTTVQSTLKSCQVCIRITTSKITGVHSKDGLRADPDKVSAILKMEATANLNEVRSFLGMADYYHTCIPEFAHTVDPLVELTRKHAKFYWSAQHQSAFDSLKTSLASEQVMAHPRPNQEYLLFTDACDYAVGAILCQKDETGMERPIVYLSKQLLPTQRR